MNDNIPNTVIENISNFIEKKFGLYFSKERFKDLMRGISCAAKQKDIDLEKYIDLILENRISEEDIKILASCLTIGETYFFRDKSLFEIMKQKILPDIINSRKNSSKSLKIWSAGCSSGEEAYSIAILVKELIPDYENWNIDIIATDINYRSLGKAREGIYGEWSFRGVDSNLKNKYFDKVEDIRYKLKDSIMELVKFHSLNLADPNYIVDGKIINNVDIIFCRNVLMYFSRPQISQIINRFYNIIANEGWLVVAPTESMFVNDTDFKSVNINNMFLFNKDIAQDNSVKIQDNHSWLKSFSRVKEIKTNFVHKYIYNKNKIKDFFIEEERNSNKLLGKETVITEDFELLCRSSANEGNFEEALKWCEKAISSDKINPYYYYLLASIQQEQGNIDEAIISLKKSVYLDSDFIMAYFNLGNLKLKQGKHKEAYKSFENAGMLLNKLSEEDIVPHSEDMTAGMLKQIISNIEFQGELV
ncbi:CheR family methyltransferase [Clostridium sp. OS1-26]|uniref:CheR family methyltransferase n=1 Tax=Clostridium sp. OS1-26 TaxID=3070681 RepID=UPI0027E12820|nr:CheR family methyltransferase [Clostridium sp. OS1-26]WML37606.1 CheR family methyltransferase [Clostridium sp. OS1-26]